MKHLILGLAALLSASAAGAVELVTNGGFETVAAGVTGKTSFQNNVTGWGGGGGLTFIDYPGTADDGSYLSVYGPFPATSPAGGKFVEADGDPSYAGALTQTINGLTIGKTYVLNFYQAAGQQQGFTGATTERWSVTFGAENWLSSQFSLASGAVGPWQAQTHRFTATATSQLLSFLASGTPQGQPPISFLDGVSLQEAVPEPASWALMITGFGMVGFAARRRRLVTLAA